MKCDIYKSDNKKGFYVFIKSGDSLDVYINHAELRDFSSPYLFKTIEFDENSPLIAADPKTIKSSIESRGFHIQIAGVKTTTQVSGAGAALGGGILAASLGFGVVGAAVAAIGAALIANAANKSKTEDSSDES
ncbi:YcgL domain-containing protein [Aeromonas veronii]|nr:YcgL domain-containing protein [Aeromonas veronii]